MNPRLKLAGVTGDDLSEDPSPAPAPEYRQVLGPSTASDMSEMPALSKAVQALLIMNGLQAQYVINYWRVTRRKETGQFGPDAVVRPNQRYRMTTGASKNATFEEWQQVIKNFVADSLGTV